MKRRLEEPVKTENSGGYPPGHLSPPRHTPRTLPAVTGGVQPTYVPQTIKASPSELNIVQQFPVQAAFPASMPAVTSTIKQSSVVGGGLQGGAPHQPTATLHPLHQATRHKMHSGSTTPPSVGGGSGTPQQQQFQRLKVEDALTYLDSVKMKFSNQPQVYNDFLDIMKEFKSQSIDTPGVIKRVSTLFGEHPDLIVGFNTFLPPGYKIEVRSNDTGFQVQVSMPSPSTSTATMAPAVPPVHHTTVIPGATLALNNTGGTPTTVVVSTSTKPLTIIGANVMGPAQPPGPVPTTAPVPPPVTVTAPPQPLANALTSHYNHLNTITQVQTHPSVSHIESTSGSQSACVPAASPLSSISSTGPAPGQPAPQNQPVEFNHAINYVNKIKNRFQGQPDKYKKFLEILHTYQKEQKNFKEAGKQLTEAEVYSQVAKLFENQDDLLAEFGQFLPDATNHQASVTSKSSEHPPVSRNKPSLGLKLTAPYNNSASLPSPSTVPTGPKFGVSGPHPHTGSAPGPGPVSSQSTGGLKRSPSFTSVSLHHSSPSHHHHPPPAKKHKGATLSFRDVTHAEAGKYGTLNDYAFFDKVHRSLRNQDVYDNFLRCIVLYNQEIVSRSELLSLVSPFFFRHPELFKWFKEFVGSTENNLTPQSGGGATPPQQGSNHSLSDGMMSNNVAARQERPGGDHSMDIDYTTCKRLGASYCALPKNYVQPRCSGRTALCREVLNDTWVSFPTWSEDSTFVTSRKTQFEEYIYRCEDERFELDVVIETNAATIRVLEGVHKKLCRLSAEEVAKYRLDDCLGGNSPTIHLRALRRIYGEKAGDIIDGLKKNPVVAVPVVLRRLKAKEEEWREGQKGFNKVWREQNEKFYLKSLDHQGINFKQNDLKALRSKSLFNEIETFYDERHEQADESDGVTQSGPHLILPYTDKSVLDDAANLLIHHVKRQTSIHKEDKQRTKQLLRQFIPDLFHHPRQELSEDEREDLDEKMDVDPASPGSKDVNGPTNNGTPSRTRGKDDASSTKDDKKESAGEDKTPPHAVTDRPDECYTLFFGNNKWYLFLRYHQILCDRLTRMYNRATVIAQEESQYRTTRKESTAVALRLKPKSKYLTTIEVEEYYPAFLDMVKNVLDGNMEANTYEDTLREMFGIHAYIAFTLDKVVSYAVRQLQYLVSDESCTECVDMYLKESRRGGAGGPCITASQRVNAEAAYQRKAEAALAEENCFKMFIYKLNCKLTIELLDTEGEDPEHVRETEKWSAYVDRYVDPQGKEPGLCLDTEDERSQWSKAIFLSRNVRKGRDKVERKYDQASGASSSDTSTQKSTNEPIKIDSYDDSQCRFNLHSYRMVFIVDKENYLYKRHALRKARQSHPSLSRRLATRFRKWHESWKSENISQEQSDEATEWLMGRAPDTIANVTRVLTDNPVERPPYRSYNRYRVKRLEEP